MAGIDRIDRASAAEPSHQTGLTLVVIVTYGRQPLMGTYVTEEEQDTIALPAPPAPFRGETLNLPVFPAFRAGNVNRHDRGAE